MSGHFEFHYKGYDNGVLKKSSFYCEGVFYLITFSHLRKKQYSFCESMCPFPRDSFNSTCQ